MLGENAGMREPLLDPDLAAERQGVEREADAGARVVGQVREPRLHREEVEDRTARETDVAIDALASVRKIRVGTSLPARFRTDAIRGTCALLVWA